jgi:hypothetical protein
VASPLYHPIERPEKGTGEDFSIASLKTLKNCSSSQMFAVVWGFEGHGTIEPLGKIGTG